METGLIIAIVIFCLLFSVGAGVAIYFTVSNKTTADDTLTQAQNALSDAKTDAQKASAQKLIDKALSDKKIAQLVIDKATANDTLVSAQNALTQAKTDADKAFAQSAIDKASSDKQIAQLAIDKANAISQASIDKTPAPAPRLQAHPVLGHAWQL